MKIDKKQLLKALNEIFLNYDAFLINNKYTNFLNLNGNTHASQFNLLYKSLGFYDDSLNCLNYILEKYDCYYRDDFGNKDGSIYYDGTAFYYLEQKIKSIK